MGQISLLIPIFLVYMYPSEITSPDISSESNKKKSNPCIVVLRDICPHSYRGLYENTCIFQVKLPNKCPSTFNKTSNHHQNSDIYYVIPTSMIFIKTCEQGIIILHLTNLYDTKPVLTRFLFTSYLVRRLLNFANF